MPKSIGHTVYSGRVSKPSIPDKPSKSKKGDIAVVIIGRIRGIFKEGWDVSEAATQRFPGNKYKHFQSLSEAKKYAVTHKDLYTFERWESEHRIATQVGGLLDYQRYFPPSSTFEQEESSRSVEPDDTEDESEAPPIKEEEFHDLLNTEFQLPDVVPMTGQRLEALESRVELLEAKIRDMAHRKEQTEHQTPPEEPPKANETLREERIEDSQLSSEGL